MALLDKLNTLKNTASGMANSAIESGRLNLKINNEDKKIVEQTIRIGEYFLEKLDAGEELAPEVMELYAPIVASRKAIDAYRADLAANKPQPAESAPETLAEVLSCPTCGTRVTADAKFCPQCGTKLEQAAPTEPPSEPPTEPSAES